jgi:hypothetical protein
MARDGSDGCRGVDGGLAKEVQAELGILALPPEQRAVDCLGPARWRLRAYLPAALPCLPEHSRSDEKSRTVMQLRLSQLKISNHRNMI